MNFLSLLEAKRAGDSLTPAQIQEFVAAYVARQIPDYQVAAFLMAVYFQGLDATETRALTLAMRDSGERLRFPSDPRPLVDKHSTGGVGDKVSLPLAPLLACLGFRVPMISGRGLGFTGGTLDKLDAIPGCQTVLPTERVVEQVQRVGCVICGQTERMVPADKGLYALRDVTATVPSLPLIVASILSKKLAEGLEALILDVKFGTAAFLPAPANARQLARAMVRLGRECGVCTRALLTDMNTPLGEAAGNWLEIKEAARCLAGGGPADLRGLAIACAAHLLVQTRRAASLPAARRQAEACLASGRPQAKWKEMLAAQGADLEAYHARLALDHTAPAVLEIRAPRAGFITRCDARILGEVIRDLGGGRLTQDATIDYEVGVDRLVKPGQAVTAGAVLARVHAREATHGETARARLESGFRLAARPPAPRRLIREVIRR